MGVLTPKSGMHHNAAGGKSGGWGGGVIASDVLKMRKVIEIQSLHPTRAHLYR